MLIRVRLPGIEQGDALFHLGVISGFNVTFVSEPLAEHVLILEILAGRLSHRGRAHEPIATPIHRAINRPSQNRGLFLCQRRL